MKRKASALVLLAALGGGCASSPKTEYLPDSFGAVSRAKEVPGVIGPYGEPVAMTTAHSAKRSGPMPASPTAPMTARGVSGGPVLTAVAHSGDDPQILRTNAGHPTGAPMKGMPIPGAVAAVGALPDGAPVPGMAPPGMGLRTSVRFAGPTGMKVTWFAPGGGPGGFAPTMLEAPGRYNFPQGAIYRLKLSDFPNRAGLELYPTLEVVPATSKTATFLAHSSVPVNLTDEDVEQVTNGNFVVKVVYLPDPAYQDLAAAGTDELVSTRLEPGVDPIAEAKRRGSVLLVLRLGNIDLESPNTPGLSEPSGAMMGGMFGGPGMMSGPMTLPPGAIPFGPPAGHPVKGKVHAGVEGGAFKLKK